MAGKPKAPAKSESNESQEQESYVVVTPFADIANFNIKYHVGQDVSHLSDERILVLMEKGLVKEAKDVQSEDDTDK